MNICTKKVTKVDTAARELIRGFIDNRNRYILLLSFRADFKDI